MSLSAYSDNYSKKTVKKFNNMTELTQNEKDNQVTIPISFIPSLNKIIKKCQGIKEIKLLLSVKIYEGENKLEINIIYKNININIIVFNNVWKSLLRNKINNPDYSHINLAIKVHKELNMRIIVKENGEFIELPRYKQKPRYEIPVGGDVYDTLSGTKIVLNLIDTKIIPLIEENKASGLIVNEINNRNSNFNNNNNGRAMRNLFRM